MKLNRREFLLLSVGLATGCRSPDAFLASSGSPKVIASGLREDYPADGVYARFVSRGFFIIRTNGEFVARSSICPHRQCPLRAQPDHSFFCHCHGSTFDPNGRVTHGPARRDLQEYPVSQTPQGQLFVTLTAG